MTRPTLLNAVRMFLAFLLLAIAPPAVAGDLAMYRQLPTKELQVLDGDTFVFHENGERVSCRMLGIDAPEKGQGERGLAAKTWLSDLIASYSMAVITQESYIKVDRYGRRLVWLWLEDGASKVFANLQEVREGYAFAKYYGRIPSYWQGFVNAQETARSENRGVWTDLSLERPWDWRRKKREAAE